MAAYTPCKNWPTLSVPRAAHPLKRFSDARIVPTQNVPVEHLQQPRLLGGHADTRADAFLDHHVGAVRL